MKVRLLLLLIMLTLLLSAEAQTRSFLINCGTNSSVNVEGRRWIGDTSPGNNITLSTAGIEAFTSVYNGDPVYQPLYQTARIMPTILNYTFAVVPNGDYFLRLYFAPFAINGYNANDSHFSVEVNGLRLLSEFNLPGENSHLMGTDARNSSYSSMLKEYFFSVSTSSIVIYFTPRKGSFAFVNAIEVFPEESGIFANSVSRVGSNGSNALLPLSRRGMETMYRLDVGGSSIEPARDSLWRKWEVDSSYMVTSDAGLEIRNRSTITYANPNDTAVAPLAVYESARILTNTGVLENRFNMSWRLEVDPGFDYLVRLHFCELVYDRPNQRTFRIFIDNKTAADNYDVTARAGGAGMAYREDYVDFVSPRSTTSNLWVQLGPDAAILNGLEVFKMSRNNDLAYEQSYGHVKSRRMSRNVILWAGIGAGLGLIVIVAGISTLVIKKRREVVGDDAKKIPPGWRPLFLNGSLTCSKKGSSTVGCQNRNGQLVTVRSGRRFAFAEMETATNSFDESLVIGVGGFGKVYKGVIDENTPVAVKRANPQSHQGLAEFETEISMLSELRHKHLVSLIGFCDERHEMILVYEYMANGTLRSHLFGGGLPPLSWKQRLEICIGSARGLHHLHTGSDRGIIHRDVKTTNILLDEGLVAKVSDFGLSKVGPSLEHTHVSTAVKGSFGYLDPEYFRRQKLTEKSDVYSFGVVLFEVVCGRPVINPALPREEVNLAEWAVRNSVERIVDESLAGKYCRESMVGYGEIAKKCLAEEGRMRPTMGEVLWQLEGVLQLHEAWLRRKDEEEAATA